MATRDFKNIKAGGQLSVSELQRLGTTVEGLSRFSGPGVSQSEDSISVRAADPDYFEVLITGVDTSQAQARYSGIEQQRDDQGVPSNKPGGLTFAVDYLPLYERNNIASVPTGKIVEARQGDGAFYLFTAPAGVAAASAGSKTVAIDSVNPVDESGLTIYSGRVRDFNGTGYVDGESIWVASNDSAQQLAENINYQADPSGQHTIAGNPNDIGGENTRQLYLTDTATLAEEAGCAGPFTRGFVCPESQDLPYGSKTFTSIGIRGGDPNTNPNGGEVTAAGAYFFINDGAIQQGGEQWTLCAVAGGFPQYYFGPVQFEVYGCLSVFTNQYRTFLQNRLPGGNFIIGQGVFDNAAVELRFSPYPLLSCYGPISAVYHYSIDAQANGQYENGGTFQDTMTGIRFRGGLAIGYGFGGNFNQSFGPFPDNWLN